jgi:hypothetical protein
VYNSCGNILDHGLYIHRRRLGSRTSLSLGTGTSLELDRSMSFRLERGASLRFNGVVHHRITARRISNAVVTWEARDSCGSTLVVRRGVARDWNRGWSGAVHSFGRLLRGPIALDCIMLDYDDTAA